MLGVLRENRQCELTFEGFWWMLIFDNYYLAVGMLFDQIFIEFLFKICALQAIAFGPLVCNRRAMVNQAQQTLGEEAIALYKTRAIPK